MAKYTITIEKREYYSVDVHADNEVNAARIALLNTDWEEHKTNTSTKIYLIESEED